MSENRRAIPWRAVASGMILLFILTVVFLKIPLVKSLFLKLNDVLLVLERATHAGTSLVFGYLGGGPAPFQVSDVNSNFVLAFRALPIVLVVSALSFVLEKAMRVGGVVGLSTAANVFVGMVEAPLFVRPYLARLSRGELFAIMAGGMASIAGTVLFLYGSILGRVMPDAVAHLLIAPYTLQGALGALCGFANLGSLGIMIGGLGTMAPERRAEIVDLGMKSIVAGTLATCLTAASVALIL